jgi:hypothetical protein
MRRIARLTTVGIAPLLALGVAVAPAHAADPVGIAKATLSLNTSASFGGASVTFTADGAFYGGLVANSVVTIQAAGIEIYTDANGITLTAPFACRKESVHFASTNTASCTATLKSADSIVEATWTAEAVGAAPTPFIGTCAGSATRAMGGTELILKSC